MMMFILALFHVCRLWYVHVHSMWYSVTVQTGGAKPMHVVSRCAHAQILHVYEASITVVLHLGFLLPEPWASSNVC